MCIDALNENLAGKFGFQVHAKLRCPDMFFLAFDAKQVYSKKHLFFFIPPKHHINILISVVFSLEGGRLTLAFSCECERFKVDWLRRAFPDVPVFNDMMDLGKGRAFDETSKNYTAVPKAGIAAGENLDLSNPIRFEFWVFPGAYFFESKPCRLT